MAISVRSSSIGTRSTSGAVTVNKPAGTALGDLLIALHSEDVFGTDAAMTAPAGWTQQGATYSGSGSARGKVWYRVADGSEGASFDFGQDDTSSVIMLCVTGQDTTTPFNVSVTWSQGASGQTSHVAPSITTTVDNCLLICLFSSTFNSGSPSYTPASGMNEEQDSGAAAAFVFNSVDTLVLGAAGSTGTKTATCSISTVNEFTTASLAVAPAAGGGGATLDAPPYHLMAIGPGRMSPGGIWVPAAFGDFDQGASISLSDTASGSDALTAAASLTVADTASGTDSLTAAVSLTLTDTASAADALTVTVSVPLTDTAAAADQITVIAAVALADVGAGVDALTATVTLALTDVGSGAEAISVAAAVPLTDAGSGADAISVSGSGVVSVAEAGTAADALAISSAAALAETAVGADAAGVAAAATVSDLVTVAEQIVAAAVAGLAEVASVADSLQVAASRGQMAGRSRTGSDASGRSRTGVDMDHRPRGGASMGGT